MLPVDAGGGGNGTTANTVRTLTITWDMPVGAPNPDYFEVICFTGSDPTNQTNWIYQPVKTIDGSVRSVVITIGVAATITGVNGAVRAVYAE